MRSTSWVAMMILMTACGDAKIADGVDEPNEGTSDSSADAGSSRVDADGDGHSSDVDCDDLNPAINPHAFEACDGIDNNCDGDIDEGLMITYYEDGDGDGYGVDDTAVQSCEPIDGLVELTGDCDDENADISPWALELCDGVDNDCDGITDGDDALNPEFWFEDADGDGFGTAAGYVEACTVPDGFVDNILDCDDGDAEVHPDGIEVCDGVDNNCDGSVDPDDAVDAVSWFRDEDLDGYGDVNDAVISCAPPTGYIADGTDCDDTLPLVNPDGVELCNSLDDDCDGMTDEGYDFETYYQDNDGDGRGDPTGAWVHCTRPAGYVEDDSDCNDDNYWAHPDMPELCDSVDNDCDGEVDEVRLDLTFYPDLDADGFGDAAGDTEVSCSPPAGYVLDASDCDDGNADINPLQVELCNGLDDNCDGALDEGLLLTTYYYDGDGDGFGIPDVTSEACDAPPDFVLFDTDCDDEVRTTRPGAYEMCNEIDDDCDDIIDDDCGSSPILGAYETGVCEDVSGNIDEVGDYIAVHWNPNGTWSNSGSLGFEIGDGTAYYESCFPGSPWQNVAFEWTAAGTERSFAGNYSGSTWSYTTTCAGSLGDGESIAGAIHEWTAGDLQVTKTEIWEIEGRVSRVWFDVVNGGTDAVTDFDLAFAVDWDIDYFPASMFPTLNDVSNDGDYEGIAAGEIATSEGPSTGRTALYGRCVAEQVVSHTASWTTDDDFVPVDGDGASGDQTVHFGQFDMSIAAGETASFGFLITVGEDVFEAVDAFVEQRDILCTGS